MEREGLSLPKIEVDERALAEYEQSADLVMSVAQEKARAIVDLPSLEIAKAFAVERVAFAKHLRETSWLARIREEWNQQHKKTCEIINALAGPHEASVKKVINPAINIFLDTLNAKREEEQRLANEAAKKRDEDMRLARAEALAKAGKSEQADAVLAREGDFIAPKIEPLKVAGLSRRIEWDVDPITDEDTMLRLLLAVRDRALPMRVLSINYVELRKLAKSFDGKLPVVTCRQKYVNSYRDVA